MALSIRAARVVPGNGRPVLPRADVRIEGDRITAIATHLPHAPDDTVIEAGGRVLLPGFIDAHTHALWAGDRLGELELRQKGASYLEILAQGGGIHATVRAVRAASEGELTQSLRERVSTMIREGTTTLEVKSGYGLSAEHELKMLRAIRAVAAESPATIVPTALLGHARDPELPPLRFVDQVVEETLPAVHAEFPGIPIDAYCEEGAWSVADCRRLFERARTLGHPIRLHTDQFHALGGLELALELGALSVDHLEASSPDALRRLARSRTYAVLVPASGFHLDDRYANARFLLDALRESGARDRVVLATNYNPGSSPTPSIPFVIALAARKLRMTLSEALAAVTSAPAALLGFPDRGHIEAGARADLVLLRHRDERALAYELGGNPVDSVLIAGKVTSRAA